MVSKSKIIHFREFLIFLVILTLICELFYHPGIDEMKSIGEFPAIKILGFTFLTSEILIFSFIGIGTLHLFEKIRRSGKVFFAPQIYFPLPEFLFLFIFVSCLMGFSNTYFTTIFRQMLLPVIFYVAYINTNISFYWEKRFFKIIILGLIGLTAVSLTDYYGLNILSNFRQLSVDKLFGLWHVTILTVLLFNVAAARLLFSRFDFRWLLVLLLCFFNFFFHIQFKNSIFALFISCILLFYFNIKISRRGLMKSLVLLCGVIVFISISFISLSNSVKNYMVHTVANRYFKAEVRGVDDFLKEGFKPTRDITGGRLNIWKIYFKESLKGYGFAPNGFGHIGFIGLKIDESGYMQSSHNLIALFAINSGIIVAAMMVLLIIHYIYLNIKMLSKLKPGVYGELTREDLIAMFCFSVSIIAESMFDTSIRNIHVAWVFWFCVALLLKRHNILDNMPSSPGWVMKFFRPRKVGSTGLVKP